MNYQSAKNRITAGLPALLATILAAFCCLWDLGGLSIHYHHDERTHVSVMQEMLSSGDLWNLRLEGTPYLNKPPLKMWLSLPLIKMLGQSNLSFRLLDGVFGVLTCLLTFSLAKKLSSSSWFGLVAVIFLCGNRTFLFDHITRHAVQDSALVFFSTTALYLWFTQKLALDPKQSELTGLRSISIASCIAAATLCKSIAGFLPLLVIIGSWLCDPQRSRTSALRLLQIIVLSTLPFALYSLSRYLAAPELFTGNWNHEIHERLTVGLHQAEETFFYQKTFWDGRLGVRYLLIFGTLLAIYSLFRGADRTTKVFVNLTLSWMIFAVVLFTVAPSRCAHYLGPVMPAFALIAALGLHRSIHWARYAINHKPLRQRWISPAIHLSVVALPLLLLWEGLLPLRKNILQILNHRRVEALDLVGRVATKDTLVIIQDDVQLNSLELLYLNMMKFNGTRIERLPQDVPLAAGKDKPQFVLLRAADHNLATGSPPLATLKRSALTTASHGLVFWGGDSNLDKLQLLATTVPKNLPKKTENGFGDEITFRPLTVAYDFTKPDLNLLFNRGNNKSFGGTTMRYFAHGVAGVVVNRSFAGSALPSQLTIKFGANSAETSCALQLWINESLAATVNFRPERAETKMLLLPVGHFRDGQNSIIIKATSGGIPVPLYLRWLTVRIADD